MAKTYDATLNDLIGARPDDWAAHFGRLAGIPPGPAEVLDTDLATTVQADRVFRIAGPEPALLHLELEANWRLGIPRDLLRYNTLLDLQHNAPVETVLVLLRPKAQASDHTGMYRRVGPAGRPIAEFRYHVERVWQRPADYWLAAGPGLAPLAVVTDEAVADLEPAVRRLSQCVYDQTTDDRLRLSLVTSSFMLCGLRHEAERIAEVYLKMSLSLEDSTTYKWILEKGMKDGIERGMAQGMAQGIAQGRAQGMAEGENQGRVQALRATVLRLGTRRFGPPGTDVTATLDATADAARLERMTERVLDAGGWDDVLQTP